MCEILKCEDCGVINSEVFEATCPIAEEAGGEDQATLCPDCYYQRYLDR